MKQYELKKQMTLPDLNKLFDQLNIELFSGELIRNFEIEYNRGLNVGSFVETHRISPSKRVVVMMKISKYHPTLEATINVVIHEMIHVWQIQNHFADHYHGPKFCQKMKEINSTGKYKVDIRMKEKLTKNK